MPYFNLEEAIDCPPALISDIPPRSESFKGNEAPLVVRLASGKAAQDKLEKKNVLGATNESVLSRWSDRASIQSFMNAISALSVKKQQMELKQQQQKQEMYDKFRQFMLQEQQKLAKQQQMEKNQQTQPHAQQQQQQQQQPKFRKVMKDGVLVTIPVNTRHPPGGRTVEQSSRGESGPSTNYDKRVGFGTGNILDDILARSHENDEKSVIAQKKETMSKTANEKAKGEQIRPNKPMETGNTTKTNCNENVTATESLDDKNINPGLTTSKLAHDNKHNTLVHPDNIVLEDNDSFIEQDLVMSACNESSPMNSNSKSNANKPSKLEPPKEDTCIESSESGHENKQSVVSDTASDRQGTSKLDTVAIENTRTDHVNTNMKCKFDNGQGNVKLFDVASQPDTDSFENGQVNFTNTGSPDNSKVDIEPDVLSPGKLVIDVDSDTELNSRVSKTAGKRQRYSSMTSDSSNGEEPVKAFERIRSLWVEKTSSKNEREDKVQETTAIATVCEVDDCQTGKDDVNPNTTKPVADDHSPNTTQEQPKTKEFEEKREASVKKDVLERKRKESAEDEYQINTENRKKIKQNPQEGNLSISAEQTYTGRITRSMAFSDVESPQLGNNEKRRSSRRPQETIVSKQVEETPSLLSMVSDEVVDVTVAQQELSDKRKNHKRCGKKKKKKKPTKWFLQQKQKEKEMLQRSKQPPPPPREIPVTCLFFPAGKCAKGATCMFKHEKIKELCRFYASRSCDKFLDGMCPNMHDEFPCMFFHKSQCLSGVSGTTCKYSHAPLTDETREILEKHCVALEERRQLSALVPPVSTIAADHVADVKPMQEKNEPSTSSDFPQVHPGGLQETKPSYVGFAKPGVGLNSALLTKQLRTPTESAKVKRLCSLSSYKPQLLTSLASFEKVESQPETVSDKLKHSSSTGKSFLPGLFKER